MIGCGSLAPFTPAGNVREVRLMRKFLLSSVALLASFGAAHAGVVVLASATGSASSSTAAPAGTGAPTPFGPGGAVGGWSAGLIPFVVTTPGTVNITVTDVALVGDVFQVALNGSFIGESPEVPLGGSTNSVGVFHVALSAGAYTLGIEDILLSYMGNPSPFGGTNPITGGPDISPDFDPAGLSFSITEDTGPAVPEPMTLATLGVGLVGLGAAKWRRRK
jgi:PEP-CTERM motif